MRRTCSVAWLLLLAPLVTAAAASEPARDSFVLLAGADTIAVERFTSTTHALEGEVVLRAAGLRARYALECDAAGLPHVLHTEMHRASDPAGAPGQFSTLEFHADSVVVTSPTAPRQAFAAPHGALPYLNPSVAMLERAVRRARAIGGDSADVPLFSLSGGRTFRVTVVHIPGDSVRLRIAGTELRFALGEDGEVTGGVIPSQGLRIVRGGDATLALAARDYSAPEDAPYVAEEVRVPGPGGIVLGGTLTRPREPNGTVPCVVTITGSGLEDRDEALSTVRGYRPFRQVADALGRAGIAVLRLDDRGYGASGGDGAKATTADFADDTRAALAWLRGRADVDGTRLFLLGHSEGGLVAPLVAADDPAVAGIVLLAAPAWTGRRVIEYQQRQAIARARLEPAARRDSVARAAAAQLDAAAAGQPWLRWFLDHDPLPVAKRVHCPVLLLQGATDQQVSAGQAGELAQVFRKAGNRDVVLDARPGLDHLFLPDTSGDPSGYAALPVHEVPAAVLATIVEWVRVRAH